MVVALVNYTRIIEVNGLITLQHIVANVRALCEVIEVSFMFLLLVSMFFKWPEPLDTCQSFACHPFHQRAFRTEPLLKLLHNNKFESSTNQ